MGASSMLLLAAALAVLIGLIAWGAFTLGVRAGLRRQFDFSAIKIPPGFQRWGGFPCPVHGEQPIDVIFRSAPTTVKRITGRTGSLGVSNGCWWWHPQYDKIIAVRYLDADGQPVSGHDL